MKRGAVLSTEMRERIVEACDRLGDVHEVAEMYHVSECEVYRLHEQMEKNGHVEVRTSQRGRKPKLSPDQKEELLAVAKAHPDRTFRELKDGLGLDVSDVTIWNTLHKMGFRFKNKVMHASEQGRPRCAGKTQEVCRNHKGCAGRAYRCT